MSAPDHVRRLCDEFGIVIVPKYRYPEPGQTRAVTTMERILHRHGEGHLRFVLSTIAETEGAGGLLTEVTLWAVSDLVCACPQWADERTSDWLEAWDRMPFGEMIFEAQDLSGFVSQRAAVAGMAYRWLAAELATQIAEPARIMPKRLDNVQKIEIGRRLLAIKAELPPGHFGPWLRERPEISLGLARQCMRLVKGTA